MAQKIGFRHSEKTKLKMSVVRKGRKGHKHSCETKLKIGEVNKGRKPNLGRKFTNEHKLKMSEAHKGHKFTDEHKRKIGEAHKGNKYSLGYKHSEETKQKMSLSHKGEKSSLWKGGISFEPYGLEFNEDLREVIRNRDRRKCQICEKTELENDKKLDCHHIDYNKQNNNPNNLISLCRNCHQKTNFNREYWIKYLN